MARTRAWIAGAVMGPCALLLAFSAGFVFADARLPVATDERLVAARELIDATGAGKQFETVVPMMVKQLEPILLQVAPGKETEIKDIMQMVTERFSARKSEMLEIVAGIYADKLSETEMRTLTAFFSEGAGATFVARQPEIVQESMTAGQTWGAKIGLEIEQEIRQEFNKRGIKI
jgi:hypothetical protein